jgi:hypothetical protein
MYSSLSTQEIRVLKKWARAYRSRWHAFTGMGGMAIITGAAGLMLFGMMIAHGRRLGLGVVQTILGAPLDEPAQRFCQLALGSSSCVMLATSAYCAVVILLMVQSARRFRVVAKIVPRELLQERDR